MTENALPEELLLGKKTGFYDEYTPSVLQCVPRSIGRSKLKLKNFEGYDLWRLYEIGYLDGNGLPHAAAGAIKIPATSSFIVESKSLKLYVGSFAMTKLGSLAEMENLMRKDLSLLLKCEVQVSLFLPESLKDLQISAVPGICLEQENPNTPVKDYAYDDGLLTFDKEKSLTEERLYTNLFRSLCPVTGQPDLATVHIAYRGQKIDHKSLLRYLIALRTHQGFHEQCAELIFSDIKTLLKPSELSVMALFTRRGGIDINPLRSDAKKMPKIIRTLRQ